MTNHTFNAAGLPRTMNDPAQPTADWHDHEHVSEQVQLEAQRLVECAGSLELAKKAIDVVEKGQPNTDDPELSVKRRVNDRLKKALELFETQLETPIVAGDVPHWLAHAKEQCCQLGQHMQEVVQSNHTEIFKTICKERPEQANQVEKLKATDAQLLADLEQISLSLARLTERADFTEPDERKVALPLEEVIKQGLAFVIGARRQEVAIDTWFMEAFNRVDGNLD